MEESSVNLHFKIKFNDDAYSGDQPLKVVDRGNLTYKEFCGILESVYDLSEGSISGFTYIDEDNDEVAVGSNEEFKQLLKSAHKCHQANQCCLLHITTIDSNSSGEEFENIEATGSDITDMGSVQLEVLNKVNDMNKKLEPLLSAQTQPPVWFKQYMTQFKGEILQEVQGLIHRQQHGLEKPIKCKTKHCPEAVNNKTDIHRKIEKFTRKERKLQHKMSRKHDLAKLLKLNVKLRDINQAKNQLIASLSETERQMWKESVQGNSKTHRMDAKEIVDTDTTCIKVKPGVSFEYTWTVLNCGQQAWTEDTRLNLMSCSQGFEPPTRVVQCPPLESGDIGQICMEFIAPRSSGSYSSIWNLSHAGYQFGQCLTCMIVVDSEDRQSPPRTRSAKEDISSEDDESSCDDHSEDFEVIPFSQVKAHTLLSTCSDGSIEILTADGGTPSKSYEFSASGPGVYRNSDGEILFSGAATSLQTKSLYPDLEVENRAMADVTTGNIATNQSRERETQNILEGDFVSTPIAQQPCPSLTLSAVTLPKNSLIIVDEQGHCNVAAKSAGNNSQGAPTISLSDTLAEMKARYLEKKISKQQENEEAQLEELEAVLARYAHSNEQTANSASLVVEQAASMAHTAANEAMRVALDTMNAVAANTCSTQPEATLSSGSYSNTTSQAASSTVTAYSNETNNTTYAATNNTTAPAFTNTPENSASQNTGSNEAPPPIRVRNLQDLLDLCEARAAAKATYAATNNTNNTTAPVFTNTPENSASQNTGSNEAPPPIRVRNLQDLLDLCEARAAAKATYAATNNTTAPVFTNTPENSASQNTGSNEAPPIPHVRNLQDLLDLLEARAAAKATYAATNNTTAPVFTNTPENSASQNTGSNEAPPIPHVLNIHDIVHLCRAQAAATAQTIITNILAANPNTVVSPPVINDLVNLTSNAATNVLGGFMSMSGTSEANTQTSSHANAQTNTQTHAQTNTLYNTGTNSQSNAETNTGFDLSALTKHPPVLEQSVSELFKKYRTTLQKSAEVAGALANATNHPAPQSTLYSQYPQARDTDNAARNIFHINPNGHQTNTIFTKYPQARDVPTKQVDANVNNAGKSTSSCKQKTSKSRTVVSSKDQGSNWASLLSSAMISSDNSDSGHLSNNAKNKKKTVRKSIKLDRSHRNKAPHHKKEQAPSGIDPSVWMNLSKRVKNLNTSGDQTEDANEEPRNIWSVRPNVKKPSPTHSLATFLNPAPFSNFPPVPTHEPTLPGERNPATTPKSSAVNSANSAASGNSATTPKTSAVNSANFAASGNSAAGRLSRGNEAASSRSSVPNLSEMMNNQHLKQGYITANSAASGNSATTAKISAVHSANSAAERLPRGNEAASSRSSVPNLSEMMNQLLENGYMDKAINKKTLEECGYNVDAALHKLADFYDPLPNVNQAAGSSRKSTPATKPTPKPTPVKRKTNFEMEVDQMMSYLMDMGFEDMNANLTVLTENNFVLEDAVIAMVTAQEREAEPQVPRPPCTGH